MNEGLLASWLGLPGIPREAETIPLERDLRSRALTGGALPRRPDLDRRCRSRRCARAKADGASVTAGVSINNLVAQRERRRRLPHLLQALAAAARRGRPAGDDRGAARRHDRRHRLLARSAGRRHQAPALRRGRRRRDRAGDAARRGAAPLSQRRRAAAAPGRGAVDRARPKLFGLPGGTLRPARRPTSSWSISTSPGSCSEADIRSRSKNTLLRGRAAAGPGLANDGCGPHSLSSAEAATALTASGGLA